MFDYIKLLVDQDKNAGSFFLTGTQSWQLMKNVSESLAGRAGVISMPGLSMRELDQLTFRQPFLPDDAYLTERDQGQVAFSYDLLLERIHKGFFPELYEIKSDLKDWYDFYSSYFQTYIEKDIRDMLNIQDEMAFINFVRATASWTGQMLSLKNLSDMCGKDLKTVKAWLSALESSGLVYLLQPYYNNFSKRLLKTPKLYFLDTGLACWLLGWNTPEQLVKGAMWGHIFETFVIAEILKSYLNDGINRPPLFYYRDKEKNEIDLLISADGSLFPVEIKASSNPQKAMISAFRLLQNIPGVKLGNGALVCLASQRLPLTPGNWILPAHLL